jgi:NRAMP (natural resistance-associated macrophage protein)-like metal ion transporter
VERRTLTRQEIRRRRVTRRGNELQQADEIRGALGTVQAVDDGQRRTWRQRALALAAIMGPGLIVMVGDNDAGGMATYAQAGQDYRYSLLWVLLLLIPVLIVNQEMVVRLGAVAGVGHAKLINERFGRFWGFFSVGDLFLLNFLTIATEFIGIALAAQFFGISKYIVVPLAAVFLVGITMSGNFQRWERFMFVLLFLNLGLIPLAIFSHPDVGATARGLVVPGIAGGVTSASALLIIQIVGTTVAPWQLFFQQSHVIDKRITPRWMGYERTDTIVGSFVVVLGATCIIMATAAAFGGTHAFGQFTDALGTAEGLAARFGRWMGALWAVVLLDASIVGASAVTLATSYAFGDVFGLRHSLNRPVGEAKAFYFSYAGLVGVAAAIVLIPGAPLGLITEAVQALAGILLPSATVFLLLLCNDPAVLGPWVNKLWLNIVAAIIVGLLVVLSLVLVITTVFPNIDVSILFIALAAILVAVLLAGGGWFWLQRRKHPAEKARVYTARQKNRWRMPPLALLQRPVWSMGRQVVMWGLAGYIGLSVLLLFVRAVQLAAGR